VKPGGYYYTSEQNDWFRKQRVEGRTCNEMAADFNSQFGASICPESVRHKLKRLGLGEPLKNQAPHHQYTSDQSKWIEEHVAGCPFKDLTERFNERFGAHLTEKTMRGYASDHGWRNGLKTRPSDPNISRRCPIGAERMRALGHGRAEVFVKVSDEPEICAPKNKLLNWEHKKKIVWEAANGPVPEGHTLFFKDGDILNCELANLQLIKRALVPPLVSYGVKLTSPTPEIAEAKEKFVEFVSAKAAMQRNAREKRKALRDKKQEACKNG
jgi:hypothetical protein